MRRIVMFSDSFGWMMWLKKSLSCVYTGSPEWCLECHLAPFYSTRTVKYHLEQCLVLNEATVKHRLRSTYVDDIISGADSDEEAFEWYTQAQEICHRKFVPLKNVPSESKLLEN